MTGVGGPGGGLFVDQLTVQDSQLAAHWEDFLQAYCVDLVRDAALEYPEKRSVVVEFKDIQLRNPDLADYLLSRPGHALRIGASMLHQVPVPVDPKPLLYLRVKGLPDPLDAKGKPFHLTPSHLRSEHLNRLVAMHGIVSAARPVGQFVLEACFDCRTCGNRLRVIQEDELLKEPVLCDSCEKTGPWDLRSEDSRHVNLQYLFLQEAPEHTQGSETPTILSVRLTDDLVNAATMGSRVVITGIVAVKMRKISGKKSSEAEVVMEGVHIELDKSETVDLISPPDEVARFEELAKQPDVHRRLADSLSPSIQNMSQERLGLLYCLVGGDSWTRPDGKRERGKIHLLFAGDPGVAKSKMLGMVRHYVPRLVTANAIAASAAGLRAAAIKEPGTDRWMIEPGKLVLANGYYVFIDELPHLGEEDLPALNDCMEEGVVSIDKVVKAIYPADATVLAAMNPAMGGRFDRYTPFIEQLQLPSALLSRFDLKFCILDEPDKERDGALARAQLSTEAPKVNDVRAFYGVALSGDELRRYLYRARNIHPKMSPAAADLLQRYYVDLRQVDLENPSAGARQIDALRRLATASAKIRLSEVIDEADAKRALDLFRASLRSCRIMDSSGRIDGNLLEGGQSKLHVDRLRLVLQIVKDLVREHPDGMHRGHAKFSDIVERAGNQGIDAESAKASVEELRRTGRIYQKGGPGEFAPMRD